jgi:hypothetical protein
MVGDRGHLGTMRLLPFAAAALRARWPFEYQVNPLRPSRDESAHPGKIAPGRFCSGNQSSGNT